MNDFFDDLWNTATGVFEKYIDFESLKLQNDLALETYRAQREIDQDLAPQTATVWSNPAGSSIPWGPIMLGVGVLGVAYIAFKR